MIHKNAKIDEGAIVGPFCVIHENAHIQRNTRVKNSVIMERCEIESFAKVCNTIMMNDCKIKKWSTVINCIFSDTVLVGEDCEQINAKLVSGSVVEDK